LRKTFVHRYKIYGNPSMH